MKRLPEINRGVIENFLLHVTHCDNTDKELDWKKPMTFTPEELYQHATDYIAEDHVDGYGKETEYCIQLWLDAEECNRNDECKKAELLKVKLSKEYEKLHRIEKKYVNDYLDSIGG